MLKEILYIHIETNNLQIAYSVSKPPLHLTAQGGELYEFDDFLTALYPEINLEKIHAKEALILQKKLYYQLQEEIRQAILLELIKFREHLKQEFSV